MNFKFDKESFNQREKWWTEHGNPDIVISPRWDNQIMFYNKVRRRETATITKWAERDGSPCVLDYVEKEQINQFMKVNNELPTIICENCGKRLMPGDCFYKWGGHNFCSKSCVATYITEQADLPKYVFE